MVVSDGQYEEAKAEADHLRSLLRELAKRYDRLKEDFDNLSTAYYQTMPVTNVTEEYS